MKSTPSKKADRVPLTRTRALEVALSLADAGGVEALSMRKLAQELGVEAMSLYHHVPHKEDILGGMVELVFTEMERPPLETDWKTALRGWATSVRTVLARHPWAIGLMFSRPQPGPATLGHIDALLGCLRHAGFSVSLAAHALSLLDSYIYGFVLQEVHLPVNSSSDLVDLIEGIAPQLPSADLPHLLELTVEHVLQPGYDYRHEFDYGFGLILEGLEGRLERGG